MDKEQEIKLQFLVEAKDYLDQMESSLIGLSISDIEPSTIDGIFRSAHSLKGGAGMMGYSLLQNAAHGLEDFFRILKSGKVKHLDDEAEYLLLQSVDQLRDLVNFYIQRSSIPENWYENNLIPIFAQLEERLGRVDSEVEVAQYAQETGQDMIKLLFETEVDGCLERLENVLAQPDSPCLREEFLLTSQEFASLGEMLQLKSFISLSQSIHTFLEEYPDQTNLIAKAALEAWRRTQALIAVNAVSALPTKINLPSLTEEWPNKSGEKALSIFSELEITDVEKIEPTKEETNTPITLDSDNTIRISLQHIEQLSDLFGELTIERNGLELQLKRLKYLLSKLKGRVKILEQSNFRLRNAYDSSRFNQLSVAAISSNGNHSASANFDSLEMDRYNEFHLISGEVMETIVQIQELHSDLEINLDETERNSRDIKRTAKMMQTNITKVRMRPISDLLARFPRALREMSLQYGKAVELKIKGGSTLIDRSILEKLNEPMLHLMRNAFDHGIEHPNIRRQLGKSEKGLIEISALHRGNQTIITVSDDGAGIDIDKIRASVKQLGVSSDELLSGGDRDLVNLIFEPGFTTKSEVTEISGRGVGMDIVRTNLRQIRGQIEVDTKPGFGTTFTITVPFTLSVVRVLLVETQELLLAFPSNSVEEIILLNPEMVVENIGQEVLNWDGFMIPLIRLQKYFNSTVGQPRLETENVPLINQPIVLIIAQGDDLVGIQVDRYWGEQEVTIRPVEGNLKMPPGFSGCTILGDGRVVPLIDAIALLRHLSNSDSRSSQNYFSKLDRVTSPRNDIQKPLVMVVDDSINVRRFLALTLEKGGYRVEQAKDGQEGLEKLQGGLKAALVVCDIEMPRLDGYGFLAHVKADADCQKIPVVMLTSRSGEKHRQLAFSLGASHYFTKPFKEQELLETIQQLTRV